MSENEIDLQPVEHITADAIGQPGKRVFYVQGWQAERTITLIIEKVQLQSLAIGYEQFLAELHQRFPDLGEETGDYREDTMHIHPPVDPLFRVGEVGLGYDADEDLVVLVMKELVSEGERAGEEKVVRLLVHSLAGASDVPLGNRNRLTRPAFVPAMRRTHGARRSFLPQTEWT